MCTAFTFEFFTQPALDSKYIAVRLRITVYLPCRDFFCAFVLITAPPRRPVLAIGLGLGVLLQLNVLLPLPLISAVSRLSYC